MGKIIRRFLTALLAVVIGLIIARALISGYKGEFKRLTATDNLKRYYSDVGAFKVKTHKIGSALSTKRQFSAYALRYVPEAEELQITLRYNDGTYRYAGVEQGTEFLYTLRNGTTEEQIPGTVNGSKRWLMYHFVTVSFEGVRFDPGADDLSVLSYVDDQAFDEVLIHHHTQEFTERELTKAEIRSLDE
ncbi:MAG: hypothetical protein IKR53_04140 [Clostridia bacterium]|nr:hypothetical protein [Clostridia bacterium]MBR6290614.1 hypothetical protein [Clostridia bacterium]